MSSKKGTDVFDSRGGIAFSGSQKSSYIKFSDSMHSIVASAPILGISIQEKVDYSMLKMVDGNFSMLVFQDHPVVITIQGMTIIGKDLCGSSKGKNTLQMYWNNRLGQKNRKPILVTIENANFNCVIVGCTHQGSKDNHNMLTYSMTLIGVRC